MVNADNNQHSPNENMRIGHLQNAREIFEAILTTPMKR
jgi:acetylornithine deacetylase/succinyl-diaminopimelate desuccinylase-like protein